MRKEKSPCQLVYSSTSKIEKKVFLFFYPHTLTFRLKRPVYRGFNGEGKCEGKTFTLTPSPLPSHSHHTLALPAGKHQLDEHSCICI